MDPPSYYLHGLDCPGEGPVPEGGASMVLTDDDGDGVVYQCRRCAGRMRFADGPEAAAYAGLRRSVWEARARAREQERIRNELEAQAADLLGIPREEREAPFTPPARYEPTRFDRATSHPKGVRSISLGGVSLRADVKGGRLRLEANGREVLSCPGRGGATRLARWAVAVAEEADRVGCEEGRQRNALDDAREGAVLSAERASQQAGQAAEAADAAQVAAEVLDEALDSELAG